LLFISDLQWNGEAVKAKSGKRLIRASRMREDRFVVKAAVANDCGAAEKGKRKSHTGEVCEGDG